MKYLLCLLLFSFTGLQSRAQYQVTFRLINFPKQHSGDSIFIAGNFNSWNPHNISYLISPMAPVIKTTLPAGLYEFRCTRGSWKAPESHSDGGNMDSRLLQLSSDTLIELNIEGWKDDFGEVAKMHTASPQVQLLDTAFYIPQLDRSRRIWIYLPEGYTKSKKRYPVLYMHDGQNLFDEYTAGYGEWGVDECLDSLIKSGRPASIVVGIANGPKRFNEYNPYDFAQFGKGEGDKYIDFIAETLKPFIDKNYRTLPSKENTLIAGSSMGGLISYYAMLKRPDVFGRAGVFSPAFWTASEIKAATDSLGGNLTGKLFFYMGGLEGGSYIDDMKQVQEKLGERSTAMLYSVVDPASRHNEQAWRKWFAEFYNWIMADGFNFVIQPSR